MIVLGLVALRLPSLRDLDNTPEHA
jgi:hypothetical protein